MTKKEYIERNGLVEDLELMAERQAGERQQGILGVCHTIRARKTADVVEPDKLKKLIECKYGSLDNTCGCNVNGRWLSVAAIVELIEQAVRE